MFSPWSHSSPVNWSRHSSNDAASPWISTVKSIIFSYWFDTLLHVVHITCKKKNQQVKKVTNENKILNEKKRGMLHYKITWDWRWPPNMCWIMVVSWDIGGTAFSPPNSSRQTDCIVSMANLQDKKGVFINLNQTSYIIKKSAYPSMYELLKQLIIIR